MAMNQFGVSIRSSPRRVLTLVSEETPAVQHKHVIAEHEHFPVHRRRIRHPAVPELSRLIGSVRSTDDCIAISAYALLAGGSVNRPYLFWHEGHAAFRTLAGSVLHHLRMHDAGVLVGDSAKTQAR